MTRAPLTSMVASVACLLCLWTSSSEATWPRYRVNNSYSLPSVPAYRPVVQQPTVLLPGAPLQGYVTPGYGAPAYAAPGYVAPAYTAPNVSVPGMTGTNYYAPPYTQPGYAQPGIAPTTPYPGYQAANYPPALLTPPPTTSYYAPQAGVQPSYQPGMQPAFQPYQQPRPIYNYAQPVQPYGGFYQPNRPATFYSPTPTYNPQPVFGGY